MSFLRHREIFPSDGGAGFAATPPLIVWMSFRLAIPRRVALQHCRLRFTNRVRVCGKASCRSRAFHRAANLCLNCLCQRRGQAQNSLGDFCGNNSKRSLIISRRRFVSFEIGAGGGSIGYCHLHCDQGERWRLRRHPAQNGPFVDRMFPGRQEVWLYIPALYDGANAVRPRSYLPRPEKAETQPCLIPAALDRASLR